MKTAPTSGRWSFLSLLIVLVSTPVFLSRLDPTTHAILRGHLLLLALAPLCLLFIALLVWQLLRQPRR